MPVMKALIGGSWVELPQIGADEVHIGATAPTDSGAELWFDTATPWGYSILTPVKMMTGTTYAPVLGDENYMILLSNAASIVVTLPANSTTAFVTGTEFHWMWYGGGQPTFVAGINATVNGTPSLGLRSRYSVATTKRIDVNEWVVFGDLG